MSDLRAAAAPPRVRIIAAFAAVYLIWGSTYLAMRFADESLPPFLMAGTRFLIAGALLYGWLRLRGAARPSRVHWRSALIVGVLLLVAGNGMVAWSELVLPSSLAALLISTVPIWIALLDWLRPGGRRPSRAALLGLALGFAGVFLLIGPDAISAHSAHGSPSGFVLLVVPLAALSWAAGSLYSRSAKMPATPLLGTGMEMLVGGVLLLALAVVTGEPAQLHLQSVSPRSLLAVGYLIIFGSLVGFTAYVWLLRATTPAHAATYAYVNPVVAVFLGWAFDNEPLSARTLIAAAIIIAGVVVITSFHSRSVAPDQARELQQTRPRALPPALAEAVKPAISIEE
ncbi:MAG TPA: drug/metabolite exporter YedA [Ktedonobacterales bacterium]|nr:drug/metabolite exporter YedA [Ktedonobacterales bacterium]